MLFENEPISMALCSRRSLLVTSGTKGNDRCSGHQGSLLLDYPLLLGAFLAFSSTVPTTGFPFSLRTSIRFRHVLIMFATKTLHKYPKYIQDPYLWRLITDVTPCSFTVLVTYF